MDVHRIHDEPCAAVLPLSRTLDKPWQFSDGQTDIGRSADGGRKEDDRERGLAASETFRAAAHAGCHINVVIAGMRQAFTNFGATIGFHNGGLETPNPCCLELMEPDYNY